MNCGNCGNHIVQARNGRWYHSIKTDIDTGDSICHIEMDGCKNPNPFKGVEQGKWNGKEVLVIRYSFLFIEWKVFVLEKLWLKLHIGLFGEDYFGKDVKENTRVVYCRKNIR